MKNLTAVIAVSNVKSQIYQLEMLFESMREFNFKYPVHLLVYKVTEQEPWMKEWDELNTLYPEIQIFKYSDNDSLKGLLAAYHNLHRFFSLREHFKQYNLDAILYLDSDIIFTKELDIDDLIQDDINYGADINSYNNWTYFTGKRSMVRPEKLQDWDTNKPLNKIWDSFNLSEEVLKSFDDQTAGVPFLLKNITWEFWEECLYETVPLKKTFDGLNQKYIKGNTPQERSNNGWQSFCVDMWEIIFKYLGKGVEMKIDRRLDFAWATSDISEINSKGSVHNAGITPEMQSYAFYKGRYISGIVSPFDEIEEPYLEALHNSTLAQRYASWYYLDYLIKVRNKNHR